MTAKVFEDRRVPGDWRVEWFDDDGGCEVAIFSGPKPPQETYQKRNGTVYPAKIVTISREG
jgi:hypothetical protein